MVEHVFICTHGSFIGDKPVQQSYQARLHVFRRQLRRRWVSVVACAIAMLRLVLLVILVATVVIEASATFLRCHGEVEQLSYGCGFGRSLEW